MRPLSARSASRGSLWRPVTHAEEAEKALAQENAIQANVRAKRPAKTIWSEVTFAGLITL